MAVSVQLTFRDFPSSPAVTSHVERRASKLDTFFDRIMSCHVVVEQPHKHSRHGQRFHVRIDMHVPGKELVVSRTSADSAEDLHATIDEAFAEGERVLDAHCKSLKNGIKPRVGPPEGVIATLFPERGYGFIESEPDGHEVYFHQNSVVDGDFAKLAVGTRVRFAEEAGDKGPQASTVHVVR